MKINTWSCARVVETPSLMLLTQPFRALHCISGHCQSSVIYHLLMKIHRYCWKLWNTTKLTNCSDGSCSQGQEWTSIHHYTVGEHMLAHLNLIHQLYMSMWPRLPWDIKLVIISRSVITELMFTDLLHGFTTSTISTYTRLTSTLQLCSNINTVLLSLHGYTYTAYGRGGGI